MQSTILHYLYEYVKFNRLTSIFFIVIGGVLAFKLLPRIRLPLSKWTVFILILVLGLFLRIAWLGYSAHTPQHEWNATHMLENDRINVHAIELAQQGIWFHNMDGTPSGRRPIGYPTALALVYKIFGVDLRVAWAFNLMLYALTIFFLFGMAEKIFGEKIALITSLLFAIYPMSIYSIKLLTDEHLFLPMWYAGLFMLFLILDGRKITLDWLWLGLIFGYATMTRTHSIFMPYIAGLTFWLLKRSWKEVLGKLILVALVMQIINLPWVIRNCRAWKVPVLYATTSIPIYGSFISTATAESQGRIPRKGEPNYSPEFDAAEQSGNEGLMHQIASREMRKWIVTHPLQFVKIGSSHLLDFMCFNRKSGVWAIWHQYYPGSFDPSRPLPDNLRKALEECAFAFYYVVFFTWLFGSVVLVCHWKTLSPLTQRGLIVLAGCFMLWFLGHTVVFPDRKYRFPLEPLMLITTAYFFSILSWPQFLETWLKKRLSSKMPSSS